MEIHCTHKQASLLHHNCSHGHFLVLR